MGFALCLLILFLGFLAYTDPKNLPAVLLLAPLSVLFLLLATVSMLVSRLVFSVSGTATTKKQLVYSIIFASVPVIMLLLRSVDQLTVKDVLLISILASVIVFYLRHFRIGRKIE